MWCKCVKLQGINLGCLNIPYSVLPQNNISIRIKLKDEYVDFRDSEMRDVFIIVRKINDNNASNLTRLSISNGAIIIDGHDSRFIRIISDDIMNNYIGDTLFYQMFMEYGDNIYPLMYGEFNKQKTFIS